MLLNRLTFFLNFWICENPCRHSAHLPLFRQQRLPPEIKNLSFSIALKFNGARSFIRGHIFVLVIFYNGIDQKMFLYHFRLVIFLFLIPYIKVLVIDSKGTVRGFIIVVKVKI